MTDDKKYYWLKLKKEFFRGKVIKYMRKQQNGPEYVCLYIDLCLEAMNTCGILEERITQEIIIPYDAQKISDDLDYPVDTVRVALELFKLLGLVLEQENGVLYLPQVAEMIGCESKYAEKQRLYREKKKQELLPKGEDNVGYSEVDNQADNVVDNVSPKDNVEYIVSDKVSDNVSTMYSKTGEKVDNVADNVRQEFRDKSIDSSSCSSSMPVETVDNVDNFFKEKLSTILLPELKRYFKEKPLIKPEKLEKLLLADEWLKTLITNYDYDIIKQAIDIWHEKDKTNGVIDDLSYILAIVKNISGKG